LQVDAGLGLCNPMPGVRDGPAPKEWFEDAFGFAEKDFTTTKSMFEVCDHGTLLSKANNKKFHIGSFDVVTLDSLARRADEASLDAPDDFMLAGDLSFVNIVADTRELYGDIENNGAVFQVSSLFNCLETMKFNGLVGGLKKHEGVTKYADHEAQGSASAIACPPATIYRHYFANEPDQVDCLAKMGELVNNEQEKYWVMRNGYCEPYVRGSILKFSQKISADPQLAAAVKSKLQVGVHWDTEVWNETHRVTQVFCSGLPVADFKSTASAADWEGFARAILEAAYEATLTAALVLATERGSRVKVYLTPVGGGVLGNRRRWIVESIDKALSVHRKDPLDVYLVHYADVPDDSFRDLERGRCPSVATSPTGVATASGPSRRPSLQKSVTSHALELTKQWERDQNHKKKLSTLKHVQRPKDTEFNDELLPPCHLDQRQNMDAVHRLMRLFATYDANGDGYIETRAFQDMLQHIVTFAPGTIDKLVMSADATDSGSIHYAEFLAWVFDEDCVTESIIHREV